MPRRIIGDDPDLQARIERFKARAGGLTVSALDLLPPQPQLVPRSAVELLTIELLKLGRRRFPDSTAWRLMWSLEKCPTNPSSERLKQLRKEIKSVLRARAKRPHPPWLIRHQAELLAQQLMRIRLKARNQEALKVVLRQHIPALLRELAALPGCSEVCPHLTERSDKFNKLIEKLCGLSKEKKKQEERLDEEGHKGQVAIWRYEIHIPDLRNEILAYHHHLSPKTIHSLLHDHD